MKRQGIAIYGSGGFGREVAWLIQSLGTGRKAGYEFVCYIDDDGELQGTLCGSTPVVSLDTACNMRPRPNVVCGIGNPRIKQMVAEKAEIAGFKPVTLIHSTVQHSGSVVFGEGTLICSGSILTTNIDIGRHVHVNLSCTIGHDVVIGDYATLSPGVHISGCVRLGKRVFIGSGAVIVNGTAERPITIGDDAVIAAGACVVKSIPHGQVAAGVPARPLRQNKPRIVTTNKGMLPR